MIFIAFDLETTGTVASVDKIVEIGAIRFADGQPVGRFSTLIDPQRTIPEGATRVNGITDEMVKGKPTIDQMLSSFADFCRDDILVAHNSGFDAQFLTFDINRFESPAPKGAIIDTLPLARKIFPGLANYKLETIVNHLKIKADTYHRAEADAHYCGLVFYKMLKKISATGDVPLQNLVALTARPEVRFPQIIPQAKQLSLL